MTMTRPPRVTPLLLLACLLAEPAEARRKRTAMKRPADAVEVFRCGFDQSPDPNQSWDVNYDGWPDRWTRKEGPGYAHYVEIGIADDKNTDTGRRLRIALDGAQAKVSSPPIRVSPKFGYFLELKIKLEQVEHSRVHVQLDYLNSRGEIRQTFRSDAIKPTGGWAIVTIDPDRPKFQDIDRAIVTIDTERGDQGDLHGVVSVADLWIGRRPSLDISANNPNHVYTDPSDVVITCSLSGIRERDPIIRFQLLDATSHELGGLGVKKLNGREIPEHSLIREESRRASEIVDGVGNHAAGYEGSQAWKPQIEKHGSYGFYQVRVEMLSSESGDLIDDKNITLAVISSDLVSLISKKALGEFGWTLPTADDPLSFDALQSVLPLLGVNWVKLPIWFDADHQERGEEIIKFAERLAASDIELVGVIHHPQAFSDEELGEASPASRQVANVFSGDPSRWLPLYDHIMTRLSLRIRWWQLGVDGDTSFVGYANLVQQISDIRHRLYRFGQDVGLGLGWRWDTALERGEISWEFNQMSSNPPLTADQLDERLGAGLTGAGRKWVLIKTTPLDPSLTDPVEKHVLRVREFIKQIVVAKQHGADGIFLTDPFSGADGVMTPDGKPGELLLPWRTAAMLLGGAEYMGDLRLPSGSRNWLFRRADGQVVMVLWNDRAVDEVLYLGDRVTVLDVWGKKITPRKDGFRDVVPSGRLPRFVVGLNESVARWRMSTRFESQRVPSIFGQNHANTLILTNGFRQGVGVNASIFVPDMPRIARGESARPSDKWSISASGEEFGVGAGKEHRLPMEIKLDQAAIGPQPVRVDFEVRADRVEEQYRFSVWRSLEVGAEEIDVRVATQIDDRGRLIVHQAMSNASAQPVSFKCTLTAPSRKRKRAQVFQLGPELDTKNYSYSNGAELLGKELTLKAVEIDGPRTLILRFIAMESAPDEQVEAGEASTDIAAK